MRIWLIITVVLLAACQPSDRRPGQWLSGEVQPTPADWSFTEGFTEVQLETNTWYGIPHSVTVVLAYADDTLYVPSIYEAQAPFPGSKFWNKNVASDPDVRLKVGNDLYELRAVHVADDAGFEAGFRALAEKYPFWKEALEDPEKRPPMVILRLEPRQGTT